MARICLLAALLAGLAPLAAEADSYDEAVSSIESSRQSWSRRAGKRLSQAQRRALEAELSAAIHRLARRWLGTRWGLGLPQTDRPGGGKINCGMFVGTVLEDAGFVVDVRKLQRQPAELIIESFVGRRRIKRFSNASMNRFLAGVRSMGPGLYIIGLDFHVGFLVQTERDLRFVHASYVTRTVVDEPAATAVPIVTSKYRVVGKILSAENLADWLRRRRIEVRGSW